MKRYVNQSNCHLMIREDNPSKRNENNIIKFNINQNENVQVGDEIAHNCGDGKKSIYTITEILEIRPSSLSGKNYITAKTSWRAL